MRQQVAYLQLDTASLTLPCGWVASRNATIEALPPSAPFSFRSYVLLAQVAFASDSVICEGSLQLCAMLLQIFTVHSSGMVECKADARQILLVLSRVS